MQGQDGKQNQNLLYHDHHKTVNRGQFNTKIVREKQQQKTIRNSILVHKNRNMRPSNNSNSTDSSKNLIGKENTIRNEQVTKNNMGLYLEYTTNLGYRPVKSFITKQNFSSKVYQNELCLEIFGQVLPEREFRDEFVRNLRGDFEQEVLNFVPEI